MKSILFVYEIEGTEFEDTEAFGEAWKKAKAFASAIHAPIYRTVVKADGSEKYEVYYKGGCFNTVKFATPDNIKIFGED